jgi:hypothetical protein
LRDIIAAYNYYLGVGGPLVRGVLERLPRSSAATFGACGAASRDGSRSSDECGIGDDGGVRVDAEDRGSGEGRAPLLWQLVGDP